MIYSRNGQTVESLPDDFYSTQYYTDILLEFLEGNRGDGQPFFAYLSYTAPHDPLHAPKKYIEKYNGVYDLGWDELRQKRLQALKELGIIQADRRQTVPTSSLCPGVVRDASPRATTGSPRYGGLRSDG